jgi:CBS domain containing-hemolysin-like protein
MTPRPSIATISSDSSAAELIALSVKTGYSRFPVVNGSSDDIVGIAHLKLAVAIPREKRGEVPVTAIMVEPMRVPETMAVEKLMIQLRSHGLQVAVVVDEYGGTAGLATLEDLVEELVGELADEHDRSKVNVTKGAKNSVLFPGMKRPDELEIYAIHVPEDGSYETVGGFIMSELGRIPVVNDEVEIEDGKLIVVRMDGRRVDRVRFVPNPLEGGEAVDE